MTEFAAGQFDHLPPHSIEAEMCFLASLMLADAFEDQERICRYVERDAFYQVDHQIVFDACRKIIEIKRPFDPVVVFGRLKDLQLLEEVGGSAYLGAILNSVPSWRHWRHYGDIILRCWDRRRAIALANDVLREAYGPGDAESLRSQWTQNAAELARIAVGREEIPIFTMHEAMLAMLEARERGESPAIPTGFSAVDTKYLGAFSAGCYTLIAAYPSTGKSSLFRNLAGRWARKGIACGLIAVEEGKQKIGGNYISDFASVANKQVAYGHLNGELERMRAATESAKGLPWYGIDSAFRLGDIVRAFDKLAVDKQCKVIGVDHIQCIIPDRQGDNGNERLEEISMTLKARAKMHGVAMAVMCQLKKPDGHGEPPPPDMQSLRGSGAMFQDCDVAIGLHRKDIWHRGERNYVPDHLCDLLFLKTRNFEPGYTKLIANMAYQRFEDYSEEPNEPDFTPAHYNPANR